MLLGTEVQCSDPAITPVACYNRGMDPKPLERDRLNNLARDIIKRVRGEPWASTIVLGGYFALAHYLKNNYRKTNDLDAWWSQETSESQIETVSQRLRDVMDAVASDNNLTFHERTSRGMLSLELQEDGETVFSFQIAPRTREILPPHESPYPPVKIETIEDNLASKMTELVSRGAPRDFRDVYTVVRQELATVDNLWALWELKNPGVVKRDGQRQVIQHIEAIDSRRPLSMMPLVERDAAEALRSWLEATSVVSLMGSMDSMNVPSKIDYSVYPDVERPIPLSTPGERADYLARICGAWDFGFLPTEATFDLFNGWRDIFDEFPLPHSPSYLAFRTIFGWSRIQGCVLQANWERLDDQYKQRDEQERFV